MKAGWLCFRLFGSTIGLVLACAISCSSSDGADSDAAAGDGAGADAAVGATAAGGANAAEGPGGSTGTSRGSVQPAGAGGVDAGGSRGKSIETAGAAAIGGAGQGGADQGGAGQGGAGTSCTADDECGSGQHCSGTLASEHCVIDSDWHCNETNRCSSLERGCNVDQRCVVLKKLGEDCAADQPCQRLLLCDSGKCVRAAEGNTCITDDDCQFAEFCRYSAVGGSSCESLADDLTGFACVGPGNANCGGHFVCDDPASTGDYCKLRSDLPSCANDADCSDSQFCWRAYGVCFPRRDAGSFCNDEPTSCAPWTYCYAYSASDHRCIPAPKEGEPCFDHRCGAELKCQATYMDGRCMPDVH